MHNRGRNARRQSLRRFIQRLDARLIQFDALDQHFFWARLGALLVGGVALFLAFLSSWERAPQIVAAAAVAAFAIVVYFHRRLDRAGLRFRLARAWAASQLGRMDLDWQAIPLMPDDRAAGSRAGGGPSHPFASDLNLTGARSLHHLLDTALSRGGSLRLLNWLLEPVPNPQRIASHQAILAEMIPLSGFRSRLALNGALVTGVASAPWDGEQLLGWLEGHAGGAASRRSLALLGLLALLNISFFVLYFLAFLPPLWMMTFVVYIVLYTSQYRALEELFHQAQQLNVSLDRFRAVLVFLEKYPYRAGSRLEGLCAPFCQPGRRPSQYLRRIAGIASAASLQGNPIVWAILNAVMPWDLYFAHRLQLYRQELRALLPSWLDTWYELEALNSLANFAYLNPGYTFPVLLDELAGEPVFTACDLGHPLLPHPEKVCNDFVIQDLGELAIVTGSNMSGKSTFLRTLGVNLCLAYTGGPVNAARLRTLPFRLFTCIQVSDSLSDGISYFYAEVRRLKALLFALEEEHTYPLFFLIDEIFRGTNNRERQAGSRSYVRALAESRGVGAISTHDLELVRLEDEIPGIFNFHFREDIQAKRMVFDYKLRSGPSPTTNALKIMQIEGLPVEAPEQD